MDYKSRIIDIDRAKDVIDKNIDLLAMIFSNS